MTATNAHGQAELRVWVDAEQLARAREAAAARGLTMSDVIRAFISAYTHSQRV